MRYDFFRGILRNIIEKDYIKLTNGRTCVIIFLHGKINTPKLLIWRQLTEN